LGQTKEKGKIFLSTGGLMTEKSGKRTLPQNGNGGSGEGLCRKGLVKKATTCGVGRWSQQDKERNLGEGRTIGDVQIFTGEGKW